MNNTKKIAQGQCLAADQAPHRHCEGCHALAECRPSARLGVALCGVCAFLLSAPDQAPLIRNALVAAGKLATCTTPGGFPGDERYAIEVQDAEARILLPIVGVASRAVRRLGWRILT